LASATVPLGAPHDPFRVGRRRANSLIEVCGAGYR
jgi:hypothetical protein